MLKCLGTFAVLVALCGSLAAPPTCRAANERPIKAVFICGGCCHDYLHQKDIITQGISKRANVAWTIAYEPSTERDVLNPIYKNPDWSKDFDVIVHDECTSQVKDLDVINNIVLKPHKDGLPAVVLHCAMHAYRSEGWPKEVTPWFELTGLRTTGHREQAPIAVSYIDPESPITKGLENWITINEELYNNQFGLLPTTHPLARGKQTTVNQKTGAQNTYDDVCVWTNLYNGKARVFATTLGHQNNTCNDPRYLDLVTQGLLWSVGKLDEAHRESAK